jgi:hypothetical protein
MVVQHLVLGKMIESWTGQQELGHVVEGETLYDDSLEGLARLYGVPWTNIADATFEGHDLAHIYGWLSTHGGSEPTPGVYGMAVGMVMNIPNVSESKSPINQAPPGVDVIAAGPGVVVGDPNLSPPIGIDPMESSHAAVGGDWTMWLLLGVAAWILFTPTKKGGKGRKLTARRGRRKSRKSSWW